MFDGIRWSTPWFWFTNTALLVGAWIFILYRENETAAE
jgi:hypothetical protein